MAKKFENPFAGGIQGMNKQITADQSIAKYKNNPAYNVTDHGPIPVKHDAPVASPLQTGTQRSNREESNGPTQQRIHVERTDGRPSGN